MICAEGLALRVDSAQAVENAEIAKRLRRDCEVAGTPSGRFEVVEVRELLSGDRTLTTMEDRVTRAAGTYTSSQRIRVPADLAVGLYRLRARVRVAGLESEGEAVFVVE